MDRILYFSHDIREPRGGIGVLYDHVAVLRRNGFDAFIVHTTPDFRYPFGPPDVPVVDASSKLSISRDDVLVIPEDLRGALRSCRSVRCRKVLFCQGHFLIFDGLAPGETWSDFGFSGYLCVSAPIQRALKEWFGVAADIVRPGIDPVFFGEATRRADSPLTIACMPRKGRDTLRLVRGLLAAHGFAAIAGLSWLEIEGLPRAEVAARLRQSCIYVSTSRFEGLGLPPLEAMAAGCLVVGFAGSGGLDYASPENGVWVPDDDPWALAAALKKTVAGLNDPALQPALMTRCRAGHATALTYSRARFERDLIAFWTAQR
jgi:glycosyltransferase involved in cell wall biosynthesis